MDATPSHQKKSEPKGPMLVEEKIVNFCLTRRVNQHDEIDPATLHLHWVQLVQDALSEKTKRKSSQTMEACAGPQFNTASSTKYTINNPKATDTTVTTRLASLLFAPHPPLSCTASVPQQRASHPPIRNLPRIQKLLRDNGMYFTEHTTRWPEERCP